MKDTIVTDRAYEKDPLDPALWSHAQVVKWLATKDEGIKVGYLISAPAAGG